MVDKVDRSLFSHLQAQSGRMPGQFAVPDLPQLSYQRVRLGKAGQLRAQAMPTPQEQWAVLSTQFGKSFYDRMVQQDQANKLGALEGLKDRARRYAERYAQYKDVAPYKKASWTQGEIPEARAEWLRDKERRRRSIQQRAEEELGMQLEVGYGRTAGEKGALTIAREGLESYDPHWAAERWQITPEERANRQAVVDEKIMKANYTLWKMAEVNALEFYSTDEYADFYDYFRAWVTDVNENGQWDTDIGHMLGRLVTNAAAPLPISELQEMGFIGEYDLLTAEDAVDFGYVLPEGSKLYIYPETIYHQTLVNPDGTTEEINLEDYTARDWSQPQNLNADQFEVYFEGTAAEAYGIEDTEGWMFRAVLDDEGNLSVQTVIDPFGIQKDTQTGSVTVPGGETFTSDEWVKVLEDMEEEFQNERATTIEEFNNSSVGDMWATLLNPSQWEGTDMQVFGDVISYYAGKGVTNYGFEFRDGVPYALAGWGVTDLPTGQGWSRYTDDEGREYLMWGGWGSEPFINEEGDWERVRIGPEEGKEEYYELPTLYDKDDMPSFVHVNEKGEYWIDLSDVEGRIHLMQYYPLRFFQMLRASGRNKATENWLKTPVEDGGMGWTPEEILLFYQTQPGLSVPAMERDFGLGVLNIIPRTIVGGYEGIMGGVDSPGVFGTVEEIDKTLGESSVMERFLFGSEMSSAERQTVQDIQNFFNTAAEGVERGISAPWLTLVGLATTLLDPSWELEDEVYWDRIKTGFKEQNIGFLTSREAIDAFWEKGDMTTLQKTIAYMANPLWIVALATGGAGVAAFLRGIPLVSRLTRGLSRSRYAGRLVSEGHLQYEAFRRGWSVFRIKAHSSDLIESALAQEGYLYEIWTGSKTVLVRNLDEAYNLFTRGNIWGEAAVELGKVGTAFQVTLRNGNTVGIWDIASTEELIRFIAKNHKGRLMGSWWAKVRGKAPKVWDEDAFLKDVAIALQEGRLTPAQLFQYCKLELRFAEGIGEMAADVYARQLAAICNIKRALPVKNGFVEKKAIVDILPNNPAGKSLAIGDVLEFYKYYIFKDPKVPEWIDAAHRILDGLIALARREGVQLQIRDLYFAMENAHWYPRFVIGKKNLHKWRPTKTTRKQWYLPAEKQRVFTLMEDGLKDGYIYSDMLSAFKTFTISIYRRIGQQRINNMLEKSGLVEKPVSENLILKQLSQKAISAGNWLKKVNSLDHLIDKARGTALTKSERSFLKKNFPEMSRKIKLGMSEKNYQRLKAEALQYKKEAELAKKLAASERSAYSKVLRRHGYTEGYAKQPGIQYRIMDSIKINGIEYSGGELSAMLEKVLSAKVNWVLDNLYKLSRGFVTVKAALDLSAPFIQGWYVLGHDFRNLLLAMASGNPKLMTMTWFKSAVTHFAIMLEPRVLTWFRNKNIRIYNDYGRYGLSLAGDTIDFYKGTGVINRLIGTEPIIGTQLERLGIRWERFRKPAQGVMAFEEKFGTIPVVGRATETLFGRAQLGFGSWGEMARIEMIKSLETAWLRGGGTRMELVEFVNMMTGTARPTMMGVGATQSAVEGMFMFAPSYYRANLMILNRMLPGVPGLAGRGARGLTGRMAQEYFASAAGAWTAAYAAICVATGNEIKLKPWPKKYGGDGAEAFTIPIGGHNIGIPGFMIAAYKMVSSVGAIVEKEGFDRVIRFDHQHLMENFPEYRFLMSRMAPPVNLVTEMITGRDFMGNKFEDAGDYIEAIYDKFITIAMSSVITQDPPAGAWAFGAELLGLRTFPESEWDKFYTATEELLSRINSNILAEEQYEKYTAGTLQWSDLHKWQKETLLQQNPDLQEQYDLAVKASQQRESNKEREYRVGKEELGKARNEAELAAFNALVDENDTSLLTTKDLSNAWRNIGSSYNDQLKGWGKGFESLFDEWAANWEERKDELPNFDIAYHEWYSIWDDANAYYEWGDPNWDIIEARKQAWINDWDEEFYAMVLELEEYGLAERHPLKRKQVLDNRRLSVFWELGDDKAGDTDAQRQLREGDPEIDATLNFWGSRSTFVNENAEQMVRDWCEEYGVPESAIPALSKLTIPDDMMEKYNIPDNTLARQYANIGDNFDMNHKRFLKDNPEFYQYWLQELDHQPVDFSKVPSSDEQRILDYYDNLPKEQRSQWRYVHPDYDIILVKYRSLTPITEWYAPAEPETVEQAAGQFFGALNEPIP